MSGGRRVAGQVWHMSLVGRGESTGWLALPGLVSNGSTPAHDPRVR